jgi:hypothetical protein
VMGYVLFPLPYLASPSSFLPPFPTALHVSALSPVSPFTDRVLVLTNSYGTYVKTSKL